MPRRAAVAVRLKLFPECADQNIALLLVQPCLQIVGQGGCASAILLRPAWAVIEVEVRRRLVWCAVSGC